MPRTRDRATTHSAAILRQVVESGTVPKWTCLRPASHKLRLIKVRVMLPTFRLSALPSIVIALALSSAATTSVGDRNSAQVGAILGVIGGIVNQGNSNPLMQAWQNQPQAIYDCLATLGLSANQLALSGISPYDSRARRILSQCGQSAPVSGATYAQARFPTFAPTPIAPSYPLSEGPTRSDYVIDGLALGAAVYPDSQVYKSYSCRPSEQFVSFNWCAVKHPMVGKMGPYNSFLTFLQSPENTAIYILQAISPAYFSPGDIDHEIQRLSQHFGQQARVLYAEPRPEAPHAVIAVWGNTTLTPLDATTMAALRRGETITAGLLVDYLGSAIKSARAGLPVFHLGDGAGFIWGANFDDAGRGDLRIVAISPTALPDSAPSTATIPIDGAVSPAVSSFAAGPTTPSAAQVAQSAEDQARRDRLRAEHLEKASAAAKNQIVLASRFIRENPKNPQLLDYISALSDLNAAIDSNDPDQIEKKSTDIQTQLGRDKDYQAFQLLIVDERNRASATFLVDAIRHAQEQKAFLITYISAYPLGPDVGRLNLLLKQIDPALVRPDLTQLQTLTGKIDLAMREANLEESFNEAHKAAAATPAVKASSDVETPGAPKTDSSIPTTEKNRFLMEGDVTDVVILYSAGASAPRRQESTK
jgi:hypothetical protein